jgi:hypothetical protein
MNNLDGFQKLVSTRWTFSISILIGLERQDHQAQLSYNNSFLLGFSGQWKTLVLLSLESLLRLACVGSKEVVAVVLSVKMTGTEFSGTTNRNSFDDVVQQKANPKVDAFERLIS